MRIVTGPAVCLLALSLQLDAASEGIPFPPPAPRRDLGSDQRSIVFDDRLAGWTVVNAIDAEGRPLAYTVSASDDVTRVGLGTRFHGAARVELRLDHDDGAVTRHVTRSVEFPHPDSVAFASIAAADGVEIVLFDTHIELCRVPAGAYRIGIPAERLSSESEVGRQYMQQEQHSKASYESEDGTLEVSLLDDFFIGRTEVSNRLWAHYQAVQGRSLDVARDPWALPVSSVSFDDARAFCGWLGERLAEDQRLYGFTVRLPTEIEWEIAARGDANGPFPGSATAADVFRRDVAPCGSRPGDVSPFAVLDMGGNLREWTETRFVASLPRLLLEAARAVDPATPRLVVSPHQPGVIDSDALVVPVDTSDDSWVTVKGGAAEASTFYQHNYDVSTRRKQPRGRRSAKTGFRVVIVPASDP